MGYFSYFIKCLIRNFAKKIFSPKGYLFIFIIIFLLYLFCGSARAEGWTDTEITALMEELQDVYDVLIEQLNDLEQVKNNVDGLPTKLDWINGELVNIRNAVYSLDSTTDDILTSINGITTQLNTLNTEIINIYNQLEENQKELLTELEADNKAVLEELNMIRDAINGSEEEASTYIDLGNIYSSNNFRVKAISLNYETRYTYKIKLYCSNSSESSKAVRVYYSDNLLPSGFNYNDYYSKFVTIDSIPGNTENYIINYEVSSTNPIYLYFGWGVEIKKIEVYRSIKGIIESLNQSNNLQQQQNQLQQEQNNFMQQETQDSSVNVGGFSNVESNDITSSGLTGVFNNIYNSISSWSSKDISLPIPYTNKSITIPANYTYNMLSSVGGGWIITFISAIYYFIVGRFLIYSITNIINSIKSGSILETDTKNNITTDML